MAGGHKLLQCCDVSQNYFTWMHWSLITLLEWDWHWCPVSEVCHEAGAHDQRMLIPWLCPLSWPWHCQHWPHTTHSHHHHQWSHLVLLQSSPHLREVFLPGVFSVLYPRLHTDILTCPGVASDSNYQQQVTFINTASSTVTSVNIRGKYQLLTEIIKYQSSSKCYWCTDSWCWWWWTFLTKYYCEIFITATLCIMATLTGNHSSDLRNLLINISSIYSLEKRKINDTLFMSFYVTEK